MAYCPYDRVWTADPRAIDFTVLVDGFIALYELSFFKCVEVETMLFKKCLLFYIFFLAYERGLGKNFHNLYTSYPRDASN